MNLCSYKFLYEIHFILFLTVPSWWTALLPIDMINLSSRNANIIWPHWRFVAPVCGKAGERGRGNNRPRRGGTDDAPTRGGARVV